MMKKRVIRVYDPLTFEIGSLKLNLLQSLPFLSYTISLSVLSYKNVDDRLTNKPHIPCWSTCSAMETGGCRHSWNHASKICNIRYKIFISSHPPYHHEMHFYRSGKHTNISLRTSTTSLVDKLLLWLCLNASTAHSHHCLLLKTMSVD